MAEQPEYVTDVPYPRNFVPHLAPPTLRLVAALGGHAPPPGDAFDYCELGAGRGDTLVTLAAANPLARFVGVDLSADHVAFARGLAERGGVENVRLVQQGFEDPALAAALPDFDYVVAHGVMSWVSPEKRAAVFRFAKAKLKPSGLLFVSYNALPGWAAVEPLRRLVRDHAAAASGSTLDRAREAYAYACRLAAAKAGYFGAHPTVQKMLDVMKEGGLAYVVHEYLHAHWHPMYFADVAAEAGANDLAYVGQAPLYLNVPDLALPPAVKEITPGPRDRIAFETLKDLAANELFRNDVYTRAPARPSPKETRRFFEEARFGALTTLANVKREVRLPVYTLEFSNKIYAALLPRVCEAPATSAELSRRPELAGLGQERIAQCFQNLCLGGQIVPMRPPEPAPRGTRYRIPSAFNQGVLEQGIAGEGPLALASPATGTGLTVSLHEAVLLHLLSSVAPEARASWLRAFAAKRTFPLTVGNRKVTDVEDLIKTVSREVEPYRDAMGPKLCQLGILEGWGPRQ